MTNNKEQSTFGLNPRTPTPQTAGTHKMYTQTQKEAHSKKTVFNHQHYKSNRKSISTTKNQQHNPNQQQHNYYGACISSSLEKSDDEE